MLWGKSEKGQRKSGRDVTMVVAMYANRQYEPLSSGVLANGRRRAIKR